MSKYEIILTVCEIGNISKAAAKLNYSQPAISQAIQSFEKELGVTLFKRSKAGMQVLPGAEDVIRQLRVIVQAEREIRDITDAMQNLERGLVRIGSVSSIATRWLPGLLSVFAKNYPNIKFELYVGSFYDLRTMLEAEDIDFAFTSQMAARGFTFVSLFQDELMMVLPPDHPLTSHISIPISWLKNQTMIIPTEGVEHEIEEILKSNDIGFSGSHYVVKEDYATTVRLVEYGFGISILPRLFLEENRSDICVRPIAEHYYRNIGIASLPKSPPSFAARKFIGFTVEWLQEHHKEVEPHPHDE